MVIACEIDPFLAVECVRNNAARARDFKKMVIDNSSSRLLPVRTKTRSRICSLRVSCDQRCKTGIATEPELRVALVRVRRIIGTDAVRYPEGHGRILPRNTGKLAPKLFPVKPVCCLGCYKVSGHLAIWKRRQYQRPPDLRSRLEESPASLQGFVRTGTGFQFRKMVWCFGESLRRISVRPVSSLHLGLLR